MKNTFLFITNGTSFFPSEVFLPSWMIGGGLSAFWATLTSARDKIDPLSLTAAQLYQPESRRAKTVPKNKT